MPLNETLPQQDNSPQNEGVFEYKLLTGHARTDGSYKTDEELRTEYLRNTDELIRQMTEGVRFTDPETGEQSIERPDAVVWLDKSARPVSWLTKETWPKLAADAEGNVPDMPSFYFANIDREQWVNTIDPEGNGVVNIDRVDPTIIRSLRSIYVSPAHKQNGLTDEIDTAPSELDNKNILIVDEVYSSGRTLTYAAKFFQKAFPTAKVAGTYWMGGIAQRGNAQGNADLPVWYKDKIVTGRGVSNRNERLSQKSPSRTQRLGGWFLSTAFEQPDPSSVQLRKELKQLAHDPNVLVEPSRIRPEDDQDERIERFNGMTPKEFFAKRKAQTGRK
jgi:hypothetical protein